VEESGLDRLIILVSFEGKLMDRNARIKRLRLLSLERINKIAGPDYLEDLKAVISKIDHRAIIDKIREVRKTFDESKCMMTYMETTGPYPEPDSKYQGLTRKENADKDLVKDHNKIFCKIYEMIRDALITLNQHKIMRSAPDEEIKIQAQKMMRQGLNSIMENPICDIKVNIGYDINAEALWAEDIRDLEMNLDSQWGNEYYITETGGYTRSEIQDLTINYNCAATLV